MSNAYIGAIAQVYEGSTQFVLNKGRNHGIEEHHKFIILEIGNDIIDPETGENLGPLEIVKGRVKVLHIQDKITTLESDELLATPPKEEFVYNDNDIFKGGNIWRTNFNQNMPARKIVSEGTKTAKPLDNVKKGDKVKLITHW